MAPIKDNSDRILVEKVLEYLQGIAQVKAYNLTVEKSASLNSAIDENSGINTKMEFVFIPIMFLQNITSKLLGVVIALLAIWFYLNGSMELLNCVLMLIGSFILFGALETAGN